MSEKVIKAALLGLGTVGNGVYKVLKNQREEMEKKIGAVVQVEKITGPQSEESGCQGGRTFHTDQ